MLSVIRLPANHYPVTHGSFESPKESYSVRLYRIHGRVSRKKTPATNKLSFRHNLSHVWRSEACQDDMRTSAIPLCP